MSGEQKEPKKQVVKVSVCGAPGSGKSTIAEMIQFMLVESGFESEVTFIDGPPSTSHGVRKKNLRDNTRIEITEMQLREVEMPHDY